MAGPIDVDVIVVGGGGAGSAVTWALARRGRRVLTIEQHGPDHELGSSHGTERIFRYAYPEALYIELAREAHARWIDLETASGMHVMSPTGGVDVGAPNELAELGDALRAHGVPFEQCDAATTRERFAFLRVSGGSLFQPDGGVIHAARALAAMRGLALAAGARFTHDDGVSDIGVDAQRGAIVTTARGTVARAPVVVVTAGAWAARVLTRISAVQGVAGVVALPAITVTQEQVGFFRPHGDVSAMPTFIDHAAVPVYGLATPSGLVKVGEHGTGPVVDPDNRTFAIDAERWRHLLDWVATTLPGVDPEPVDARTCLYASTADDRFVLDRVGPVVVGAGLGGHGFKFLPAIGERLADLADGVAAPRNPFALAGPS